MFPTRPVVDVDSVYDGSLWLEHDGDGYHLSDDVRVIETPGHAPECAALARHATGEGTVALTHAWWFADMTPVEDPLAWDQAALERSRSRMLELADVVVPGHGPAFRPATPRGDTRMRILLVGAGGVGAAFAAIAARRDFFDAIVVADYDVAEAERAAAYRRPVRRRAGRRLDGGLGGRPVPRARHHPRDERGRPASSTCRSSRARLAAGADYLDMAMSLSKPHPDAPYEQDRREARRRAVRRRRRSWEAAGRLALVGIGVEPGLSDVFARYAADHDFSEIDELGTRDGANLVVDRPTTATRSSRRRSRCGPRSRSASTRR